MGMLLKDNCLTINAGASHIDFYDKCAKKVIFSFHSHGIDTMFWICTPTISPQAIHSLTSVDYGTSIKRCTQSCMKASEGLSRYKNPFTRSNLPWLPARKATQSIVPSYRV